MCRSFFATGVTGLAALAALLLRPLCWLLWAEVKSRGQNMVKSGAVHLIDRAHLSEEIDG